MRARALVKSLVPLLLLSGLSACRQGGSAGVCLDGGMRCAAAQAPEARVRELRGYRLGVYHWRRKLNRESGVPDVGLEAQWHPVTEMR